MTNRFSLRKSAALRKGATLVLMAVLLPVVLLLAAFAINLAYMELNRTEMYVAALTARLRRLGHDIEIVVPDATITNVSTTTYEGALVHRFPIGYPLTRGEAQGRTRVRGSEWHPFETIVASGPRSALPHARASDRVVGAGEWLLIDFGARLSGYCSDLTRTVLVGGGADQRQREIYGIVAGAQRAALAGLRPGLSGREGDALARDVIEAAGYGEAFGHSLGHGLGLEVHEGPRLSRMAPEPLSAGVVVTVEPGIYLQGWGGVRLEDDIHLTATGARCLTDCRTELLELH